MSTFNLTDDQHVEVARAMFLDIAATKLADGLNPGLDINDADAVAIWDLVSTLQVDLYLPE